MEENPGILQVHEVSKSFRRKQILHRISFQMKRGEICSIVGENGSGKTTLLRVIVGMLRADEGSVKLSGKMGYCPQECQLFNSLTVRENLIYFATAYGLSTKQRSWWRHVQPMLDEFNLLKDLGTRVSRLSGGSRQKLNFLVALLHAPDLLLLDEPYAAFDWESYLRFWELVNKLKVKGTAILIVSHLIFERDQIDTIFQLREGKFT